MDVYNFVLAGSQAKLDKYAFTETVVTRLAGHDTYPFSFVELLLLGTIQTWFRSLELHLTCLALISI